jgi:GNAT superfamily N-acetyltransferase
MQIQQVDFSDLSQYCTIPIAFLVESILDVSGDLPESFSFVEQPVAKPWLKDYDMSNPPSTLPSRWDLANWAIFLAVDGSFPVGGCIVAHNTPGVHMLQGRTDLAVLWDIRIAPGYRGRGLGRQLFDSAETWAQSRHCLEMQVETQNINVAACCFYQSMGCTLLQITRDAYDECPGEHQLIWSKKISTSGIRR